MAAAWRTVSAMLVAIGLTGCVARNVDVAPDFAGRPLRSVVLEPPAEDDGNTFHNSLINQRIATALQAELQARGIRIVTTAGEADLIARWRVATDAGVDHVENVPSDFPFYRHGLAADPWPMGDRKRWRVGMLVIDLVESQPPNHLMWRGWDAVDLQRPTIDQRTATYAVQRSLRALPPAR